jgi:hypothetical protein
MSIKILIFKYNEIMPLKYIKITYTLLQYLTIYSLCVQGLETETKTLQSYCVYHAKKHDMISNVFIFILMFCLFYVTSFQRNCYVFKWHYFMIFKN